MLKGIAQWQSLFCMVEFAKNYRDICIVAYFFVPLRIHPI